MCDEKSTRGCTNPFILINHFRARRFYFCRGIFPLENSAADQRAEVNYRQLTELVEKVDKKHAEKNELLNSRADKIGASIMQHHQRFTDMYGELDRKYTSECAELQSAHAAQSQHLTDQVMNIDQRVADKYAEQDQVLLITR